MYRGLPIAPLTGHYVFGGIVSGRVFSAPEHTLDGSGQAPFYEIQLIDASDGVPKSLLAIVGGGTPALRADSCSGMDDGGTIYLVTKGDGSVRRLVARTSALPALRPALRAFLALALIWVVRLSRLHKRAPFSTA